MRVSDNRCSVCKKKLTDWDYRYKGKHYCRKCYREFFCLKVCSVCNKPKMIYRKLKIPVCKFCQVSSKPCVRCKKINYTPGLITEYGPVCNTCAKYFKKNRQCSVCKVENTTVSNRTLLDGTTKVLCQQCYNRTLPICSSCNYRRKPYSYLLSNKKPLCKICSTEIIRKCKICNKTMPAGRGNICMECSQQKTLDKKINFIKLSLSDYMSLYFVEFASWLKNRRGLLFASNHIQKYQLYFYDIDKLYNQNKYMPTYQELLTYFPKSTSNSHRIVNNFLDEKGLIVIDEKLKAKYADFNLIEKYLIFFNKFDYRHEIINCYYNKLKAKLFNNKTTIRSIRLSLTPAVKYLKYCDNFPNYDPDMHSLEGYLWCYPGQKSSITEFINFLKNNYHYKISIKNIAEPALTASRESQDIMKQRLIKFLRNKEEINMYKNYFLRVLFGYLHRVHIPDNIFMNIKSIKKKNQKDFYIKLCKNEFYIPKYIVNLLIDIKF